MIPHRHAVWKLSFVTSVVFISIKLAGLARAWLSASLYKTPYTHLYIISLFIMENVRPTRTADKLALIAILRQAFYGYSCYKIKEVNFPVFVLHLIARYVYNHYVQ